MLCIGLTGGIGSGKSTIAAMFEVLRVPVLYADEVGKKLMAEDPQIKKAIILAFGEDAYTGEKLNTSFLSSIVFKDGSRLQQLNEIVHPATIEFAKQWKALQKAPYVVKEAALLFESHSNADTDYVIGVQCSLETRIKRAMNRTSITREEVMERIGKQMDETEKLSLCDYIITNDEADTIIDQVLELHQTFIQKTF